MQKAEKTVFISYRRTNMPWALAIYQNLTIHGFDVFFDYQSIKSDDFEKIIYANIKARAHFLAILTPSALERFTEPSDWMRREIEIAIDEKRNIIPLFFENFDFHSPSISKYLSGKLTVLKKYNGLVVPADYFEEAMHRLRERFLSVPVDTALTPLSNTSLESNINQKRAADMPKQIKRYELVAQELFERGYVSYENNNFDEALRYFTEAIHAKSDDVYSLMMRAIIYRTKGDVESAIADCNSVIQIKPDLAQAYLIRGRAFRMKAEIDAAIKDFNEAISLMPSEYESYLSRGLAKFDNDDLDGARADYSEAIRLNKDYIGAYYHRALMWEKKKDYSSAIADYQKYLKLGGGIEGNNQKEIENKIKALNRKLTKKKL